MLGLSERKQADWQEFKAAEVKPAEISSEVILAARSVSLPSIEAVLGPPVQEWQRKVAELDAKADKKAAGSVSRAYSTDSIKASLRVDPNKSHARLRSIKLNRSLPVRLISNTVFAMLIMAVGFMVFQFAGLVELRYHVEAKEEELARLEHQRDELNVELEQMTSLSSIEAKAKSLGMVFPSDPKKLDMSLADNHSAEGTYAAITR